MKRKLMVVGNWKMNKNFIEGLLLTNAVLAEVSQLQGPVQVVLCPPFVHLHTVHHILKDYLNIKVGAQNCHQEAQGAFTGEISVSMLQSVGAEYVIIGHSERRTYFQESDEIISQKVNTVLQGGLTPIFCCGEPFEIRQNSTHESFIKTQLEKGLFHLNEQQILSTVIAYEPIWAIGTGQTASPEQAQAMHAFIRACIAERFSTAIAESITILYGGSCNDKNAAELFSNPDVDGALVGGAALQAASFVEIIKARLALA